jgi:heme exporter protein A
MSAPRLRLSGIGCARGDRLLLRGIDLDLKPGGAALLRGANGIGKSSLLRLCAGLLRPYAGTIERTGGVALADERAALDTDLPLGKALGFWAQLDRAPAGAIDHALTAMALADLAEVPVRMLSTGQRKRASLARTILSGAPIWLLDEPGNGLDDRSLALLGDMVAAHLAGGGIAVLASHQPLPVAAPIMIDLAAHQPSDAEADA